MRQRLRQFEFRELWRPKPRIWSMNEGAQCLNTVGWTVLWWNLVGTCDEDGNWRVVCAPPRTDNARTRPQGRVVVRELVIPSAPEHFDYPRPDGAGRSIHSAWNGPCGAAIQPAADLLPCGSHARSLPRRTLTSRLRSGCRLLIGTESSRPS